MSYVVYDYKAGKPDEDTVRLISGYDPEWEIVIQYVRDDGAIRTQRIRTAPGARHPYRVWHFERMMREA
jgi:hypothetical protein